MADEITDDSRNTDSGGPVKRKQGRPRKQGANGTTVSTLGGSLGIEGQSTGRDNTSGTGTGTGGVSPLVDEAATVATVAPVAPRKQRGGGRPAGKATVRAKEEAAALAAQLTLLANTLAVTALGSEAAMTDSERVLFDISLPAVLERVSTDQAAKFVSLANPLILLFGVGVWGLRLSQIASLKAAATKTQPSPEADVPSPTIAAATLSPVTTTGFGVPDERVLYQAEGNGSYI